MKVFIAVIAIPVVAVVGYGVYLLYGLSHYL